MKIIYKFPLEIKGSQTITTVKDIKPLSLQLQRGIPTLWAEIDKSADSMMYEITMIGTGHEFEKDPGKYIGSLQDGPFVWHYYIREVF